MDTQQAPTKTKSYKSGWIVAAIGFVIASISGFINGNMEIGIGAIVFGFVMITLFATDPKFK